MKLPLEPKDREFGLSLGDAFLKRSTDFLGSLVLLMILLPLMLVLVIIASIDTGSFGVFKQRRVGLYGELFTLYKIRSMRVTTGKQTNVTTSDDSRITAFGRLLRKTKLDETPQLWNVLKADMSFVGPRPDVPEIYKTASEELAIKVLTIRPGITGPASLRYRDEEDLLGDQVDPEKYNREILFPAKLAINAEYVDGYSFFRDLKYMLKTVFR